MSDQSPRRLSRDTTERLLRGEGDPAHAALAGLLAAAAAPARGSELPGEEHALSAFRKAWSAPIDTPVTTPRRKSMLNATVAKLLTAKGIAIGLAACTGAGAVGVTVAASTGTLPDPIANALGVAKQHVPTPPAVPTPAISTPALPAPGLPNYEQLAKLCDKFMTDEAQGGAGGAGAADLRSKNFAALVTAAGGGNSAQVKEYCLKLVHSVPSGAPSAPNGVPSGVPSGLPHGGLPSGLPTGLPTGKPTWKPSWPPHPTPSLPINVQPHS